MTKTHLPKKGILDVDCESIDYDAKFKFVIERVMDRCDVADIRECIRYMA